MRARFLSGADTHTGMEAQGAGVVVGCAECDGDRGHNRRAVFTSSTANRKVSSHQVDNDNGMHARGSHGHPQANTESQQSPERIGLGAVGGCTPTTCTPDSTCTPRPSGRPMRTNTPGQIAVVRGSLVVAAHPLRRKDWSLRAKRVLQCPAAAAAAAAVPAARHHWC